LWIAIALLAWAASNHAVRVDRTTAMLQEKVASFELARVEGRGSQAEVWGNGGGRLRLQDTVIHPAGPGGSIDRLPTAAELLFTGAGPDATPTPDDLMRRQEALSTLPGARVRTWVRPRHLAGASHPWAFDTAAYYRHQGIGAKFEIPDLSLLERITVPPL